jgi:hypothetical protein
MTRWKATRPETLPSALLTAVTTRPAFSFPMNGIEASSSRATREISLLIVPVGAERSTANAGKVLDEELIYD